DGTADKIEISATNVNSAGGGGALAGVDLDDLFFETRDETMTLNFSNLSPSTSGSFDINSSIDFLTVNWSPDTNILLNGGTDSLGNTTKGIRPAFAQLAAELGGTARVDQITPTQYKVTFGGNLGAQDLLPNPGPVFTVLAHLNSGSVTA